MKRAQEIAAWLWTALGSASLPAKLIVTGAATAISGGVIRFLGEFASYAYAIHYGIRLPAEGVPYLASAVAATTLLMFFAAAVAFTMGLLAARVLAYWALSFLASAMSYVPVVAWIARRIELPELRLPTFEDLVKAMKAMPFRDLVKRQVLIMAMGAVLVLLFSAPPLIEDPVGALKARGPNLLAGCAAFLAATTFAWRPKLVFVPACTLALLALVAVPSLLFVPSIYAFVLRELGHGGGTFVTLHVNREGELQRISQGYMVLRTSSAVFLFDDATGSIQELPIDQVAMFSVRRQAGIPDAWKLPPAVR